MHTTALSPDPRLLDSDSKLKVGLVCLAELLAGAGSGDDSGAEDGADDLEPPSDQEGTVKRPARYLRPLMAAC